MRRPTFVAPDRGEDWQAWHRNLIQLVRQGVTLAEKEASQ